MVKRIKKWGTRKKRVSKYNKVTCSKCKHELFIYGNKIKCPYCRDAWFIKKGGSNPNKKFVDKPVSSVSNLTVGNMIINALKNKENKK